MKEKRAAARPPFLFTSRLFGSRSHRKRTGLCRSIALRDLAPVHRVPPRLEIVRAAVLIVQIIGVLPDVVAHQGALAVHDRVVLVRAGLDRELAVLADGDEHPARAELASAG